MSDTHTCPRPGCDKELDYRIYACTKHWFELPLPIRSAIVRAWQQLRPMLQGDSKATLEVKGEAIRRHEAATTAAEVWWGEHAGPGQLAAHGQMVAHMGLKARR